MLPSELPDLPLWLPIAVDTETNGLWADSGARVSIVSVAWIDPSLVTGDIEGLRRAVKTGEGVESHAWPFAQGPWGKDDPKSQSMIDLFSSDDDNPNLPWSEWVALLEWLRPRPHAYHNAKFDLEKLRYAPIGWPGSEIGGGADFVSNLTWDSQVTAPDIWPGETSSLKPTSDRLWGNDASAEAEALKPYLGPQTDPRYDLVPWEIIGPYAAKDTNLTIRLTYHEWLTLGLIDPDGRSDFGVINEKLLHECQREIAVGRNLYRMERAGVPFDGTASLAAAQVLQTRQTALEKALPFRPTIPAAKTWFFQDQGMLPYSVTDAGSPQLTDEVLVRVVSDYPADTEIGRVARVLMERNKLNTAINMWYRPYANGLGADGRLRTCFRQVTRGRGTEDGGTRSGRFSVERVNLQAIPHDYRLIAGEDRDWKVPTPRQLIGQAIEALPGYDGWEFDLAQAELRLAAAWASCDRMLDAMREGRDLHGETTEELFNVHKGDAEWGMYRQIGKRANFTLCFGAGGKTLAKMVQKETGIRMNEQEGNKIVRRWNGIYPEFKVIIEAWQQVADAEHEVQLASIRGFGSGRYRRFARGEDTHKAFNQLVQGSLGEFARDWNLNTERVCDEAGLGYVDGVGWTGLCLVIHDSQVLLLPGGGAGDAIAERVVAGAATLWEQFFNTTTNGHDVRLIEGYAEGKRW